jgi:cell division protein FtsQ
MMKQITIKRVLFVLFWIGVATGMGFLLSTAWQKQGQAVCKGYTILRQGGDSFVFVKRTSVEKMIRQRTGGKIIGQRLDLFPLQAIEDTLRKMIGVSRAQVFFDNQSVLQITLEERTPVARIFSSNGASYYLDSAGKTLPLSDQVVIECPVFNGVKWSGDQPDSLQARRIVALANYIQADSFWSAQVGQFDIDEKGQFELVPVAGNHRVQFGKAEDPAAAFHRLWVFYQQVLRKQGLDRYARIDVQYKGQVVASRNRYPVVADSIRMRKQVDVLIKAGLDADSSSQSLKPIKRAT